MGCHVCLFVHLRDRGSCEGDSRVLGGRGQVIQGLSEWSIRLRNLGDEPLACLGLPRMGREKVFETEGNRVLLHACFSRR